MSTSFNHFLHSLENLYQKTKETPLTIPTDTKHIPWPKRSDALIFSPHPDDESIQGGIILKLRQSGFIVANINMTLGSSIERRKARSIELKNATSFLKLPTQTLFPNLKIPLTMNSQKTFPREWAGWVKKVIQVIKKNNPSIVVIPHQKDAHPVHQATFHLVLEALRKINQDKILILTEFWHPLSHPNLMLELKTEEVSHLMTAIALHRGEVKRNPYHLSFPFFLRENVRRGSELVQGTGKAKAEFTYAQLFKICRYSQGKLTSLKNKYILPCHHQLTDCLPKL